MVILAEIIAKTRVYSRLKEESAVFHDSTQGVPHADLHKGTTLGSDEDSTGYYVGEK